MGVNIDRAKLADELRNRTGLPLKDKEIDYIINSNSGNPWAFLGSDNINKIAQNYLGQVNSAKEGVTAQAKAFGIDLSPEDLNSVMELFTGDKDQFNSLAAAKLDSLRVNKLQNPTISDQQSSDASRVIKEIYGRDAQPDEVAFFSKELASGSSPYEIAQFLQQTPEYQKAQAAKERQAIDQELQASEGQVYEKALPQIIGSYMKAGRLNSSGLDSALANARTELATQRQGLLSGYAREDVVGARNQGFQNYLRQSEPMNQRNLGISQAAWQRPFELADRTYQRQNEVNDYNRQQSDFYRALDYQRQQSKQTGLYGLGGSALSGILSGATYGLFK